MEKNKKWTSVWDNIDSSLYDTLLIDRDGAVIKRRNENKPAKHFEEVSFRPCFFDRIADLSKRFRHIILFSNFLNLGPKEVPSHDDQVLINSHILEEVKKRGGDITSFYTEWNHVSGRNDINIANPTLPLRIRRDFPAINFSRTIVVGNTESDMLLAYNCGMHFVTLRDELESEYDINFDDMDAEIDLLHREITSNIELLNKLNNSTTKINGIRLATRCICNAIANGRKIFLVLAEDSGMDSRHLPDNLRSIVGTSKMLNLIDIITPGEATSMAEQLTKRASHGDVVIFISARGSKPALTEAFNRAVDLDCITISLTGARPTLIDDSDVIIKIPATDLTLCLAGFHTVTGMVAKLIAEEEVLHRLF